MKQFKNILSRSNLFLYSLVLLFALSSYQEKEDRDYLKLIYTSNALDIEYEPCVCKVSIWDKDNGLALNTIIIYDKDKIDKFIKAFNPKNIKTGPVIPDFSNVFIYKRGKEIDTIYANSNFTTFAKEKTVLEKNIDLTLLGIQIKTKNFIPKEFIVAKRKYRLGK